MVISFNIGFTGPEAPDPNSGSHNTQAMIDANCAGAASFATTYVWPNGQIDGFLPNNEELLLMLNNLQNIPFLLGGFVNGSYWSSSERNTTTGWITYFTSHSQSDLNKGTTTNVRAIRIF